MKKLSIALLLFLAIPMAPAHAERKPWPRRPGVILYQLKPGASAADAPALAAALGAAGSRSEAAPHMGRSHQAVVMAPGGRDEEDLAQDLLNTGAVLYAEPDYLMPVAEIPSDPGYPSQWYHATIHSPAAWDMTTGNHSVIVAVCDTGVDDTHPELAANLALPGFNSVDESTDTSPVAPHGTAVAGIIGAAANNGLGGVGIAWNVRVLPVRVTNNADGSAWCSDMAEGIEWAADHGASVVNLSYDVTGCPHTIDAAAQYAAAKGGATFVAAGNSGLSLTDTFPEAHSFILVGATDRTGQRAAFSNYGRPLDLVAPGVSIYAPLPGNTYAYGTGTSFSSPISAGVAALLFSLSPSWTPDQVRIFLLATARPLGEMNGYGQVDAYAALASAKSVLAGGPMPLLPGAPGQPVGDGSPDLNSVLVYPNPWRADRHTAVPVIFGALTADSTVKIFTLSGFLVRTLSAVQGKASWDLRNDSGRTAASGIYLYSVTDNHGNQSQGKLAIIR